MVVMLIVILSQSVFLSKQRHHVGCFTIIRKSESIYLIALNTSNDAKTVIIMLFMSDSFQHSKSS